VSDRLWFYGSLGFMVLAAVNGDATTAAFWGLSSGFLLNERLSKRTEMK
jgi:hypothetical protein